MAATARRRTRRQSRRARPGGDSRPGLWQKEINVRDFIQQNYEPYDGDESFLAPATDAHERRSGTRLNELFVEERKKGVLDVSQIPSSITAHAPGYIDSENEIIVGLQTDAPLKRAIMPNGGFRMVAQRRSRPTATSPTRTSSRPSPSTARRTTKACSTPTPPTSGAAAVRTSSPGCPTPTAAAASSATTAACALYGVARLIAAQGGGEARARRARCPPKRSSATARS